MRALLHAAARSRLRPACPSLHAPRAQEQALSIAALTRRLPIALARDGRVHISDRAVAKLMGRVFIQQVGRAELNLTASLLLSSAARSRLRLTGAACSPSRVQAALNLMGSVLDTPDFFWEPGVPDSLQTVYDKVRRGVVAAAVAAALQRGRVGGVGGPSACLALPPFTL